MRKWWLAIAVMPVFAAAPASAWSQVELRGTQQDVLWLHSTKTGAAAAPVAVLFLPGDGGYRGAAKEMATTIAASGYDVAVWDTKRYLTSFTAKSGGLAVTDVGPDFAAMRQALVPRERPVILIGWSQGAAMSVVAAASAEGKAAFVGTILLALPDAGALAWRWRDNFSYLTGGKPGVPHFDTEPYLSQMAPLPTAVIQAGRDRFTARAVSRRLLSHLRHPRHLRTLEDASHDFGPDRSAMYRELSQAVHWIERHAHPAARPQAATR
jgi:dienelactone hydrolase